MTCLIDTSVLLWTLENSPKLSSKARQLIIDTENDILLSIVSIWEIAIKLSIGKLDLDYSIERILEEIYQQQFEILPISYEALKIVRELPFHHRDPFDRLIISEGKALAIPIVSNDPQFEKYYKDIVW